jgi:hypothetical protein
MRQTLRDQSQAVDITNGLVRADDFAGVNRECAKGSDVGAYVRPLCLPWSFCSARSPLTVRAGNNA